MSLLILLDLSAAFDTVDTDILLSRLNHRYGVKGLVLDWLKSYLSGRTQRVVINNSKSSPSSLKYGVPQGSVLGPFLFSVYTSPLVEIIESLNICYHLYADDTQLYLSLKPTSSVELENHQNLGACIDKVKDWMHLNKLKLNGDKTEFLVIGRPCNIEKTNTDCINVGASQVTKSNAARNLGVIFDCHLNMQLHVNNVCKSCYFHLRNIRCIRKYLSTSATQSLIHALISSRLDKC